MHRPLLITLGVCLLLTGVFVLGRLSKDGPVPEPIGDPPGGTVPAGTKVDVPPLLPSDAPTLATDRHRVRQALKPGQTYETLLRGTLQTRGTDTAWGVESTLSIYYAFEAHIDRDIKENDGEVVVEHRHFRDIRSVKIDTNLEDLRLRLGAARAPVLLAAGRVWPASAFIIHQLDGLSTAPALSLLRALGVEPETVIGLKPRVFKMFTQFDGLSGKSVKLVYWNKEERTGVIQIVPLAGDMTPAEQFLHHHSAVLSDTLVFPAQTEVGQSWSVNGSSFANLVDPGLRAALRGKLSLVRRPDETRDGKDMRVLIADGGRLELHSSDAAEGQLGWFEPRGELLFSPDDQIVVQAELHGRGLLERVSRNHILFKTEMTQTPEIVVQYTCRVAAGPAAVGKK